MLYVLPNNVPADRRSKERRAPVEHLDGSFNTGFRWHDASFQQSSLHSATQFRLLARDAKSFAMKNIGEQVQEFMTARGWKAADLAKAVRNAGAESVQRQHIEGLLAGKIERPRYIVELARVMQTTAERLISSKFSGRPVLALGDDDPIPEGVVLIKESTVKFSAGNGHVVPHYEEIEESAPASYQRTWFSQEGINPARARRFKVTGHSMETLLFDGDTVLVNLAETEIRDGLVYALRYGEELRIKRCYRRLDGGLILHSDNPEHRPRDEEISPEIVEQSIGIIGRVREKAGKGGL